MNNIEKGLSNLGYQYKKIKKEIYLIENFLYDSEIKEVLEVIKNSSEVDWQTHYMDGVKGLAERKYSRTDIDNLVDEGLVEITDHWFDKNLSLPYKISGPISDRIKGILQHDQKILFDGVGTIQRQYEGAQLTEHVDNHADPLIEYAVIMYINDDYTDGELFFSRLGIEIKPPAKSMVIFPSGEEYLHGVKPPGAGPERYVLPSFIRKSS